MSPLTRIEWTERTWNPVTGCDRVSPGCDHCYALTLAARLKAMGSRKYQVDGHPMTSGPGFGLTLHPDQLQAPAAWKKPSVVFVNSMSDLFHDKVPIEFIRQVFDVMKKTPQHTYQILTKRSGRLARIADQLPWPENVWMGVSVENQDYVIRAERLVQWVTPSVRFLSVEPMLGPVDLRSLLTVFTPSPLHWVIAGGESGPGCRPCEFRWLRDLRDQCLGAGVPFFLKQLGGHPDKRGHDKAVLDGERWTLMPEVAA